MNYDRARYNYQPVPIVKELKYLFKQDDPLII